VNIDIDTKNLKVSSSVSTDFKSTYDKWWIPFFIFLNSILS
jgi:hypothetical protein